MSMKGKDIEKKEDANFNLFTFESENERYVHDIVSSCRCISFPSVFRKDTANHTKNVEVLISPQKMWSHLLSTQIRQTTRLASLNLILCQKPVWDLVFNFNGQPGHFLLLGFCFFTSYKKRFYFIRVLFINRQRPVGLR